MYEVLDNVSCSLGECLEGDEIEIVEIHGDSSLLLRLGELGLAPGRIVRVVRRGTPMILHVGDSKICLRGEDISLIRVSRDAEWLAGILG